MTIGKTIALTRQTVVDKVMSLLFNMISRLVITFLPLIDRYQVTQINLFLDLHFPMCILRSISSLISSLKIIITDNLMPFSCLIDFIPDQEHRDYALLVLINVC